ncbi:restriction endonuclease-related protein [Streptomyces angustmyceticus]
MAIKEPSDARSRRDQALTACCVAAAAESDPMLPPTRRASMLMDCLSVLRSAHPVDRAAQIDMRTFRNGLREPLGALLPTAGATADQFDAMRLFDAHGLVRDAVEDLCREHLVPHVALKQHWSWARVHAEQEERRLYEILRRLPPEDYRRARSLLGEHPAGPVKTLRREWDRLWMRFDFFEAVSDWPWCQLDGWWYPCPECHWPMRVLRHKTTVEVRCEAHAAFGVHYRYVPGSGRDQPAPLVATGKRAKPVQGLPASTEHLALTRPVWRYGTLPTLMELHLRNEVAGLPHLHVEMWLGKLRPDEYDLHITAAAPGQRKRTWRVDAKAWESVPALGTALLERSAPNFPLTIVLPDHQKGERHYLAARLRGRRTSVTTCSRLIKSVRTACGVPR